MTIRTGALVLGAGPGGMTAALELARRGVPVAVVEARGAAATRPNVVSLTGRSLRRLEQLGATDVFAQRTAPGAGNGTQVSIALHALENRLRGLAAERGIPALYDLPVAGLVANGGDGATIALADGRVAGARYVLNATGGRTGFEHELGMGLEFAPDHTWYAAARTPYVPGRATGELLRGTIGYDVKPGWTPRGEATTVLEPYDVADEIAPFRGYRWTGLQNPLDGLSLFGAISSADLRRFPGAQLAERTLAPARELGEHGVIDPPRLLRLQSAGVRDLRVGSVLALGDSAGRTHAVNMRGTQLAIEDGAAAADAVAQALGRGGWNDLPLRRYEADVHARHRFFGWDGSLRSGDPFPDRGDVIDLPMS